MPENCDILIRNARLRRAAEGLRDIAIAGGRIAEIGPALTAGADTEIDAAGGLVTESFANPHLHMCKVWTLEMMQDDALKAYREGQMGKTMTAIELASLVKEKYDASWIADNARRAAALAALHGNLHIRAFADVDTKARLEGVKGLLAVREEFRGIVDIQVVAFAQDGIVREPGAAELMREAMELGADVVGGIPWIEFTEADAARHVRTCFDLAQEFDKDVSMLLDDAGDPGLRTLETMAVEAIGRGWEGRALAHHCRAMALYPEAYFKRLCAILKRARVPVVSDPHTGPLHARVRELLENDVLVCLGQDDISDAYYPFGRNNMLEVAFLASHLLWMTAREEIDRLYDLVTVDAARAMNVHDLALQPGAPAHLVVLDEPNTVEALRNHTPPAHVVSHGKLVDRASMAALAG
ncbi:MAG: amidohydrolase family protein [Defluviicoccus sp.]|nr:amidohydrolase family protein [Defluviicoccus sp.]MDE0384620.1 amidohydrolase family protein [Defluviicoccus sp.]